MRYASLPSSSTSSLLSKILAYLAVVAIAAITTTTTIITTTTVVAAEHSMFSPSLLRRGRNNDNDNSNNKNDNRMEGRIVGGTPVPSGAKYPSHVWMDSCGGTLVARDMVLTAAACFKKLGGKAKVGGIKLDGSDGQIIDIDKEIPHPLYISTGPIFLNDVMLVKLKNATSATTPLQALNRRFSTVVPGSNVTAIGFGFTSSSSGTSSPILNEVGLVVVSRIKCQVATFPTPILQQHLCAANGQSKGVQRGDSGSPLYYTTANSTVLQVGVSSFRTLNGTAMAVYARANRYYGWIERTICANSNYKPTTCPASS